jgi:hypothetical protein
MIPFFKSLCAAALLAPVLTLAAEFRTLAWQDTLEGVTCSALPRGAEMRIAPNAFTAWQSIKPTKEPLVFTRRAAPVPALPGTPAAPAPEPEVIARVEWPEGLDRGLLLFVPAPAGASTPCAIVLIPERASGASPPVARVFNYSAVTVAAQLGEQPPAQLAPLASFDSDDRPANGVAMLRLRLAEHGEDGWRVVVSRNIALPPGRAAYLFLRNATPNPDEPNNPKLDYKLIYDRIPLPASRQ